MHTHTHTNTLSGMPVSKICRIPAPRFLIHVHNACIVYLAGAGGYRTVLTARYYWTKHLVSVCVALFSDFEGVCVRVCVWMKCRELMCKGYLWPLHWFTEKRKERIPGLGTKYCTNSQQLCEYIYLFIIGYLSAFIQYLGLVVVVDVVACTYVHNVLFGLKNYLLLEFEYLL